MQKHEKAWRNLPIKPYKCCYQWGSHENDKDLHCLLRIYIYPHYIEEIHIHTYTHIHTHMQIIKETLIQQKIIALLCVIHTGWFKSVFSGWYVLTFFSSFWHIENITFPSVAVQAYTLKYISSDSWHFLSLRKPILFAS